AARWPGGGGRAAARGGTGGPGPRWWGGCHAWELLGRGTVSGLWASAADDGAGVVIDGVQLRRAARADGQGAHVAGERVLDPAGEDLAAGREDGTVAAVGVESVDLQRLHRGGRLRCVVGALPGRLLAGDARDRLADRLEGAVLVEQAEGVLDLREVGELAADVVGAPPGDGLDRGVAQGAADAGVREGGGV